MTVWLLPKIAISGSMNAIKKKEMKDQGHNMMSERRDCVARAPLEFPGGRVVRGFIR